MRALLLATGERSISEAFGEHFPSPLLGIVDKPILAHVIELLVRNGVTEFDIVLHERPDAVQEAIGNGKRWGANISYHLVKDPSRPLTTVWRGLTENQEAPLILGQGDTITPESIADLMDASDTGAAIYDSTGMWSGWAILRCEHGQKLSHNSSLADIQDLADSLGQITTNAVISTRNLQAFLEANKYALGRHSSGLLLPTGVKEVRPGVWIARGSQVDSTACFNPPVYIGEHCLIKEGVSLGSNVVVEANCIVDSNSKLEDVVVCRNSYVGESLEIAQSILDRNILANLSLDTQLVITDDFILCEIDHQAPSRVLTTILERALAAIALFFCAPILLPAMLWKPLRHREALALPASFSPNTWRRLELLTFADASSHHPTLFERIPMLYNILKGDMHFVGVQARDFNAVLRLPNDWQKLYLSSKLGLLTLADVEHSREIHADDLFASEAYYTAHSGTVFDLKVICRYFWRCLKDLPKNLLKAFSKNRSVPPLNSLGANIAKEDGQ